MKLLKIVTKAQANEEIVNNLLSPVNEKILTRQRYDYVQYDLKASFVGSEVEVRDEIMALWMEMRKDLYGPYQALFCAHSIVNF